MEKLSQIGLLAQKSSNTHIFIICVKKFIINSTGSFNNSPLGSVDAIVNIFIERFYIPYCFLNFIICGGSTGI